MKRIMFAVLLLASCDKRDEWRLDHTEERAIQLRRESDAFYTCIKESLHQGMQDAEIVMALRSCAGDGQYRWTRRAEGFVL